MIIFRETKVQLLSDLMSYARCQNSPIDINFHLQKSLDIFEKKSADKIWSEKDIQVKVPCPVPDRVKESVAFCSSKYYFFRLLMIERPDYHAIYSSQPQSNDYIKNNADTLM